MRRANMSNSGTLILQQPTHKTCASSERRKPSFHLCEDGLPEEAISFALRDCFAKPRKDAAGENFRTFHHYSR